MKICNQRRLVTIVILAILSAGFPTFAELEKRKFQFEDCAKTAHLDCLDIETKDGNLARVGTTARDGSETNQLFQRWTNAEGKSYELNILKAENQLKVSQDIQSLPNASVVFDSGEKVYEEALEVLISEKALNPDGIVRIKWLSFDWSHITAVQLDKIDDPLVLSAVSYRIPTYYTLMYGAENNPTSVRVIGYVDYRQTNVYGDKFAEANFHTETIVPEVVGAGGVGEVLEDIAAAVYSGLIRRFEGDETTDTELESVWSPSERDSDLVQKVATPFLKTALQLNDDFNRFASLVVLDLNSRKVIQR